MATHSIAPVAQARLQYLSLLISPALRIACLLLAMFFGAMTAKGLLWDVRTTDDLTLEHYGMIAAMVGALASGIFCLPTLRWGFWLVPLGLAIAWAGTTLFCLVNSGGRLDELAYAHNAEVRQVNQDRERAQRSRTEAQKRYETALEAETAECARGAGPRCMGRRSITQERRSDLEVAELLLQRSKPEQRENGKLKRAAEIVSLFSGVPEDRAERGLVIIWPYMPNLTWELLTIIFGHLSLAPWKRRTVTPTVPPSVPTIGKPRDTEVTVTETVDAEWTPVSVEHARQLARKVEAEGVFNALRSVQPKPVSNDELAKMLSVSKAESSRRVSDLVRVGMVRRQPAGRYVAISLRPLH